jgi:hypothetical protein
MNKLKLDVETLAVESFVAGTERDVAGTVHGNASVNSCRTGVSICAKCFYTANPCECTTSP